MYFYTGITVSVSYYLKLMFSQGFSLCALSSFMTASFFMFTLNNSHKLKEKLQTDMILNSRFRGWFTTNSYTFVLHLWMVLYCSSHKGSPIQNSIQVCLEHILVKNISTSADAWLVSLPNYQPTTQQASSTLVPLYMF